MSNDVTIRRGLSAAESPIPVPEFALGNVVKLKQRYHSGKWWFGYGIIVEHLGCNAFGKHRVSLHLYTEAGQMYLIENTSIPSFVDFCVTEIMIVTIAATGAVFKDGFDCFPPCPECGGKTDGGEKQHPFGNGRCSACGGWGHVREMVRIPKTGLNNAT